VRADIRQWAERYERGAIPDRFSRPPLSAGERLAVRIVPVRLSQEPDGRPFEEWDPRPGVRALRPPFRNDGSLYATSQRLYLVRHPARRIYEVHHQWVWSDVLSLDVVPNWRGVAMRLRDDEDRLCVVANVFHTFLVRPNPAALAAAWLKVQGAWAASRSPEGLAAWVRRVSTRLGEQSSG
jgi:hypothetical protein